MAWHGLARHGYTADRLETRPFLLCGIAVVWLPVVVSLCVWHGMTRVRFACPDGPNTSTPLSKCDKHLASNPGHLDPNE